MASFNIALESKRNSKLVSDQDNYRFKYIQKFKEQDLSIFFSGFELFAYEKNYFYLLSQSTKYDFKPDWIMRPDYTSYDVYGNVLFWPLVLFMNNIASLEEFRDISYVLLPSRDAVLEVTKDRIVEDAYNVTEVKPLFPDRFLGIPVPQSEERLKYYKKYSPDMSDSKQIRSNYMLQNFQESTNKQKVKLLVGVRETRDFTITEENVQSFYLDLPHTGINSTTLVVTLGGFNTPLKYGYDYRLTTNNNMQYVRLTWNINSSVLKSLLTANDTLTISYVYIRVVESYR